MATIVNKYGDVAVLTVKDELAGDAVEQFLDRANQTITDGINLLVVDCGKIHALDSRGLEALLELQTRCEELLGSVKLCAVDETCTKILEMTRLAPRFEFFDDLDAAVKSFR